MINFHLAGIFSALRLVRSHWTLSRIAAAREDDPKAIGPADKEVVENRLQFVATQCAALFLESAGARIGRIWNAWGSDISHARLATEMRTLLEAMEDDLSKLYFYRYPRHKALVLIKAPGDREPTIKAFPSAKKDIEEGVDCYALEKNTACVFHLMRVAEYGLRAFARERGASFPKHPIEWAEWQNLLDQAEANAKATVKAMSRGPAKAAAAAFYSGAIGQVYGFKDEYRNAVMHARESYGERQALRALNQVRDFMNRLSLKIDEETKRPIRWKA